MSNFMILRNMVINLTLFIVLLICLLINHSALAYNNEDISLKPKQNYEVLFFVPEDTITKLKGHISKDNFLDQINAKNLNITEIKAPTALKKRLNDVAAFVAIGGMSISQNVEKSIGSGKWSDKIKTNLFNPVHALKQGWKEDNNSVFTNYIGHPFEFFMLANYLKASGASDKETILLSTITNIAWEFIMEGTYLYISPKDLATDTAGCLVGILLYKTILKKPIDASYHKISELKEKYGIDLSPRLNYNPETRGVIIGVNMKITTN